VEPQAVPDGVKNYETAMFNCIRRIDTQGQAHRFFRRLNPVSGVLLLDYRSGLAETLERISGDDAG
jgi:hypothetical protein